MVSPRVAAGDPLHRLRRQHQIERAAADGLERWYRGMVRRADARRLK
jgi:hypothetical protein